jgi:predicted RNase H-like HicB family nuclease
MRCAVLIEKAERDHLAYVPDLPGCVATGDTLEEVGQQIREAIAFHIEGPGGTVLPSRRRPSRPKASISWQSVLNNRHDE